MSPTFKVQLIVTQSKLYIISISRAYEMIFTILMIEFRKTFFGAQTKCIENGRLSKRKQTGKGAIVVVFVLLINIS